MVSIIIAFSRGINYLKDCFQSLEEQKFCHFETILVVDMAASEPDEDLKALVEQYKDRIHLKVYEMKNATGVSAARNLGMDKSGGEYLFFLDSDDYIAEWTLDRLLANIGNHQKLSYCSIVPTWFKRDFFHMESGDTDGELDENVKNHKRGNFYFDRLESVEKIEDVTTLGVLYRKDFLIQNNIRFRDSQKYFADFEFVLKVLECSSTGDATCVNDRESIYVKRYHNDKINLPSISQTADEKKNEYLAEAFINGINISKRFRNHVEYMACKYYIDVFTKNFHENMKEAKKFFGQMSKVLQLCGKQTFKRFNFIEKKILSCAVKGDFNHVNQWVKIRMTKNKVFTMFSSKTHFYRTVNLYLFRRMRQKDNWIVFESFMGRNYSGQPKYIYQYLQKNYGDKYKYIWIVENKKLEIDGKCKQIKRLGLKYYYYMTRSKYWVNNMRQPHSYQKRKSQIMLETWHGTPLKKLVFDMEDVHSASPEYKQIVYDQSRDWDYLLSDNPFSTEKFQSCFLYHKDKILELGYPANDPLYDSRLPDKAIELKNKLRIPLDKKIILYAPTWRDDNRYGAGEYKFDLKLDIDRLYEKIGDEYVILLRMHYWVIDRLDLNKWNGFVFNVSNYSDVTDLYIISDICITDYSSVFFDYANLRRPILFYMYDLEKYRDMLRGFYLDIYQELPGPILTKEEQLIDAIKNIDEIVREYEEKYKMFYDRFCCIDDGNAAKRVCEKIFK